MRPTRRLEFAPASPTGEAVRPSACQAEAAEMGAADARRAGTLPVAAAAPWSERPFDFAPRPKPDPATVEPDIGWQAARQVQARRRAATTAAKRHAPTKASDAGVAALHARRALTGSLLELERRKDPVEQAKLELQRRGVIVYSLKVKGGPADIYQVGNRQLSRAELIIEAGKFRG